MPRAIRICFTLSATRCMMVFIVSTQLTLSSVISRCRIHQVWQGLAAPRLPLLCSAHPEGSWPCTGRRTAASRSRSCPARSPTRRPATSARDGSSRAGGSAWRFGARWPAWIRRACGAGSSTAGKAFDEFRRMGSPTSPAAPPSAARRGAWSGSTRVARRTAVQPSRLSKASFRGVLLEHLLPQHVPLFQFVGFTP